MNISELKTNRLLLRNFESSDLDFVHAHFSNSKVTAFLYDNEPPENIDASKEILDWCMDLASPTHVRWCITLINGSNPIGTCGFHRYDNTNNAAEIGYDLFPDHWSNGYMSEALTEMLSYGFGNLGLNRIYAFVFVNNAASNHLLEKLGFSLEGVVREKHYYKGKYYDHNLYSLLKSSRLGH
ncbi:MAG: GNAT family N-acetyltransferase [Anaerolineaceae bacterium]|nr:GNAT family N-acetyltransferase [Anaerolineaceae bacterium]